MTLRKSFGGDVQRIHDRVDALLDREDAVLVLYDGGRVVTYAEGFGVSASQLELLGVEVERVLRNVVGRKASNTARKGGIVKAIREFAMLIASMWMIAVAMAVFFDWRAKLLSRINDFRKEE